MAVKDLPLASEDMEDKTAIAASLFKEGFLAIVQVMCKVASQHSAKEVFLLRAGEPFWVWESYFGRNTCGKEISGAV